MSPILTHRQYLIILFILLLTNCFAQNKQVLYGFDQLPQTLLLNPGAEVNYDKHISIPLTNFHFQFGATNKDISYNSVFANTEGLNDVLRNIYDQNLNKNDYFIVNQQLEFFNAGLRLNNPNHYLSFGMYEEFDGFGLYPEEVVELFYEGDDKDGNGIPEFNETTNFNKLDVIGEFVGVFHIGISSKINDKLNLGTRLKFLSGSVNFNSTNNTGAYDLSLSNAPFDHNFSNLDVVINTSGIIDEFGNDVLGGVSDNLSGLFFGHNNFGMALDVGGTYSITDEITVSASVLDLGFINYSNEITSYIFVKDFVLPDDFYFDPPEGGELDYWKREMTDYYNVGLIPMDTLQVSYNSNRSPKINTSVKYTFYNNSKTETSAFRNVKCYKCLSDDSVLKSEIGFHTYTIFRPNKIGWAITGFYSREFNKYINAKITYTYDNFSMYNIGIGLSTHYKSFNLYITADNLLNLFNVKDSNYQSFQFGMNFIFNEKNK